jgi:hypothetical protein
MAKLFLSFALMLSPVRPVHVGGGVGGRICASIGLIEVFIGGVSDSSAPNGGAPATGDSMRDMYSVALQQPSQLVGFQFQAQELSVIFVSDMSRQFFARYLTCYGPID